MNDATIRRNVNRLLRAWPGFPAIRAALCDLPGLEVYLGGGTVRRVLLGEDRPVKDFDLFFDGPCLERFVERLEKAGRLEYNPYGSPRWFPEPDGSPYADLIPLRRFSNGMGQCRNMLDALRQFDCTINAVAVNLRTGAVLDPQNGRRDAARRIVRATRFDIPCKPIRPGAEVTHAGALWHRLVHYAYVLGLRIEPATVRWLLEHRPSAAESAAFSDMIFAPHMDLVAGWSSRGRVTDRSLHSIAAEMARISIRRGVPTSSRS